ncbi:MAG: glycosyltransferase family 2 protein [Nocardioidaceae bacterium]|nr:glycosyltransferase family 2 protein [Nocardioidaceae bacterium]MCL2612319.1 glycosyltransferase family 2 protein [Nocardioidaceae bacterium]
MSRADIAAVITAHNEGDLAKVSMRSLQEAVAQARAAGLTVEVLAVLDNPDDETVAAFEDVPAGVRVERVSFADQGHVRNHAVSVTDSDYLAFLDGDDLWTENWLVDAFDVCGRDPGRVIAHPEVNWFFGHQHNLYFLADQDDPEFDPAFARIANPWDALCMAPRSAHADHPYADRAVADGYAYEDWHWNLETLVAGYRHLVAPQTIHFKRRRKKSQFMAARDAWVITRPSELLTYRWWSERDGRDDSSA